MDPEYEGSDDEAAAMAAMMGFASFGGKPPAKKRKFNAATDAFVEGQTLEKIDKGGKKGQGSGGNEIKLGKQRVFGQGTGKKEETRYKANDNEIDLDLDDEDANEDEGVSLQDAGIRNARLAEDNQDGGPQYLDTSLPAPAEAGTDKEGREDGPAYLDTSTAPPLLSDSISAAEAAEVQARIDALLNSIGSGPPPPSNDPSSAPEYKSSVPAAINAHTLLPSPSKHLPNRPAFSSGASDAGSVMSSSSASRGGDGSMRGGRSRGGGHGGRGGERNEKWYEGYYDPSFNYNPWDKEEKARGLQPVGIWLEHQHQPRR